MHCQICHPHTSDWSVAVQEKKKLIKSVHQDTLPTGVRRPQNFSRSETAGPRVHDLHQSSLETACNAGTNSCGSAQV